MWRDETCLIVSFLERLVPDEIDGEEHLQIPSYEGEDEIPEELLDTTPEELGAKLITFAEKELPDTKKGSMRKVFAMFWSERGVSPWRTPPEIQLMIQKAEVLAEKGLKDKEENKLKLRLEKERNNLGSYVDACADWARGVGLKKVTRADVETFLFEKEVELLSETIRKIWSMTNTRLRADRA
jgi:hypothetical protein